MDLLRTLVLIASIAFVAGAQSDPATLSGRVTDEFQSVIPDAQAELWLEKEPQNVLQSKTDGSGMYAFGGLMEGDCALRLTMPGFKILTVKSIHIARGARISFQNLALLVGGVCGDRTFPDHVRVLPSGENTGNLGGTIWRYADARGESGPISDAEVTLVCPKDAPCNAARSDFQGQFLFKNLAPGTYTIRASHAGFYPESWDDLQVQRGFESIYRLGLEECPQGNCDPALRPKKPLEICE